MHVCQCLIPPNCISLFRDETVYFSDRSVNFHGLNNYLRFVLVHREGGAVDFPSTQALHDFKTDFNEFKTFLKKFK